MKYYSLKTRQVCFFFIAFAPITKFFILPSIVAGISAQDLWLSTVLNVLADIFTLSVLCTAFKSCETDFFDICEVRLGKFGAKIVIVLYMIFFLLKSILPLTEQKDYVALTLYVTRPNVMMFLPFFIIAFYFCNKKLRVIGRCADVFFLVTAFGYLLLIALSFTNLDFGELLPIGISGSEKIAKGAYYGVSWFGDAAYMLFFIGNYRREKKSTLKIIVSYGISAFAIVFFMIAFYASFGDIAFRQRFALTEISKYTAVINNIGRFDFIDIFMLLLSGIVSLSLPIYFMSRLLSRLIYFKFSWISPLICCTTIFLILFIFNQYYYAIEKIITVFSGGYFIILANFFPIIMAIFVRKGVKTNEAYQS